MIRLRNLALESGLLTLVLGLAISGAAAAELGAAAVPAAQTKSVAHVEKSVKTKETAIGVQAQGNPDAVVRPAAALAPERIAVEPAPRPVLPARDDPRSVEETKDLPAPADR